MFAFTILLTYALAGTAMLTRYNDENASKPGLGIALALLFAMIAMHGGWLTNSVLLNPARGLALQDVVSVIGWLFAAIGLYACIQPGFRLVGGIVLLLSATLMIAHVLTSGAPDADPLSWQLKLHAMLSLVAYSFLNAGAVLALASLVQDKQLRAARVSRLSQLLPPLMATEEFLATLTASGFIFLLLSITSGFLFVDNLFAQHLTHKTLLSLGALVIFGILVAGRQIAGWRGRRMLHLYLAGFAILVLAYFGSKLVLELLLDRQWG